MDVGTTIVDYAGAKLPRKSEARSLKSVLEGVRTFREFSVSEFENQHVMVTARWKAEFNKRMKAILLIDRKNDPGETVDLSRDRSMKQVIADLTETFERFLAHTPEVQGVALKRKEAG